MTSEMTTVQADHEARLCVEVIGDRADPALLLIAGATWSMDWWDDELCSRLADHGRCVLRYDNRDTGRSTSYPAGSPGYSGDDLVTDAVAVLDGLDVDSAHIVGLSMGGGIAQRLAVEHRDRLRTLTLIATSPLDPDIEGLPGPAPEIRATFSDAGADPVWTDREAVIDHIVEGERPFMGPGSFDERRLRTLAGRAFDRTDDMAACLSNHFLLDDGEPADVRLSQLGSLPTLVLHGLADPLFPPAHGRAMAAAIPGARLIELDGAGHEVPPPHTWNLVVDALIEHTAGSK